MLVYRAALFRQRKITGNLTADPCRFLVHKINAGKAPTQFSCASFKRTENPPPLINYARPLAHSSAFSHLVN